MEMIESLRFVVDTLPKIEIMMKILKDVTCELYRSQLMTQAEAIGRPTNVIEHRNAVGDDLLKRLSSTNIYSGDMSLGNITTLLNLYLNNTIVARDSIMTTNGIKQDALDKQNYRKDANNKANFSTLSSNIAAQNYTQPEFPSISANFTNRVSISTALIGDSSIIADCTNNFIEKIDQNEKQDPEPKIKQNDISNESAAKINKRRRRMKTESSDAMKDVESLPLESTKIEDVVAVISVPDAKIIDKEMADPEDTNPIDKKAKTKAKTKTKSETAREKRVVKTRQKVRFSVNDRNSRRATMLVIRKSITVDPKPHKCPVSDCPYEGAKKAYLNRHMTTHLKETLFPCEKCSKQFRERNALNEHMNHDHDQKTTNTFNCSSCNGIFDTERKKIQHEKKCKNKNKNGK